MRPRRRRAHLLLLLILLPHLAATLAVEKGKGKPGSVEQLASGPDVTGPPLLNSAKPDVGTKDAPVDGLDGKPKLGPFVDSSSPGKKNKPIVEDLGTAADSAKAPKKPTAKQSGEMLEKAGATLTETKQHKLLMEAQANIMDDPNREKPKVGTTGTEGGISEKERLRKEQANKGADPKDVAVKKPEQPKEAPLMPDSEAPKSIKGKELDKGSDAEKPKGAQGIEHPTDLPGKHHKDALPVPPNVQENKPLSEPPVGTTLTSASSDSQNTHQADGLIRPLHSFILSLTMILVSEVGDKTFLVAALMAMRHPRTLVFSAAFSALIAMTALSAVLGHALPTLLPKKLTSIAAAVLFLVFGAKLWREGCAISPDDGVAEEMKEVEQELEEKEHAMRRRATGGRGISPYALESGRGRRARSASSSTFRQPPRSPSSSPSRSPSRGGLAKASAGLGNLLGLLLSPAWVQTFVMTFLGEWGDRSQIATIAMAAGQDYWWVGGGAVAGHACCTGVAVLGGRAIAGRVSMRVVTLGGAYAFLVFGIIYFVEAFYA